MVIGLGALVGVVVQNQPPTPEQAAEAAKRSKENGDDTTRRRALVVAMATLTKSLRDPDSLVLEGKHVSKDGKYVCLEYRARNGFGGMDRGLAFFDLKTGKVNEVECPNMTYYDY